MLHRDSADRGHTLSGNWHFKTESSPKVCLELAGRDEPCVAGPLADADEALRWADPSQFAQGFLEVSDRYRPITAETFLNRRGSDLRRTADRSGAILREVAKWTPSRPAEAGPGPQAYWRNRAP